METEQKINRPFFKKKNFELKNYKKFERGFENEKMLLKTKKSSILNRDHSKTVQSINFQ